MEVEALRAIEAYGSGVRTTLRNNATAYGFSISVTAAGGPAGSFVVVGCRREYNLQISNWEQTRAAGRGKRDEDLVGRRHEHFRPERGGRLRVGR